MPQDLNTFDSVKSGIDKLVADFQSATGNALTELNVLEQDMQAEAIKKRASLEQKAREKVLEELAQYELNLGQLTADQIEEYSKEAQMAADHEAAMARMRDEMEFIKKTSHAEQAERAWKERELSLEKAILEKKAKGDKKGAKQDAKTLAREQHAEEARKKKEEDSLEGLGASFMLFGTDMKGMFKETKDAIHDKAEWEKSGNKALANSMKAVGKAITDGLNKINDAVSKYAQYQTTINTRLQGTGRDFDKVTDTLGDIAFSPLLKAEDLYSNLSTLVSEGIVTNVEQRAMFQTVKDGIATSFDVNDASLRKIIRLQQTDSTAARLGLESYLTKFLNVYVENTEYLQSTFDTVASSLLEASAMLAYNNEGNTALSTEFEYVVQKWLGTLTGLGLSDETAQNLATALGQLGSGNLTGLSGSAMQNLLVMAANRAGSKSYAEMLTSGIDAKTTNDLLRGVVQYLQELSGSGNNVVRSQLAAVFGVSVTDLIAVSNMTQEAVDTVHKDLLAQNEMYGELANQFDTLTSRMGATNILENLMGNLTFQTGMNIAANPIMYALWKVTDLIQGVTGGINIPALSAFGTGIDLETTVENLMKLGIVGISTLGNIGGLITGFASIGNGSVLLDALGVSEGNTKVKSFGRTMSGRAAGKNLSASTYVGNTDSDTYYESTINSAQDQSQKDLNQKQEDTDYTKEPVVKYLINDVNFTDWSKDILTSIVGVYKSIGSNITDQGTVLGMANNLLQAVRGDGSNGTNVIQQLQTVSGYLATGTSYEKYLQEIIINQQSMIKGEGYGSKLDSLTSAASGYGLGNTAFRRQLDKVSSEAGGTSLLSGITSSGNTTTNAVKSLQTKTEGYLKEIILNQYALLQGLGFGKTLSGMADTFGVTTGYSSMLSDEASAASKSILGFSIPQVVNNSNSSYLDELDFATGFKAIVLNIDKIAQKYLGSSQYDSLDFQTGDFDYVSPATQTYSKQKIAGIM